MPVLATPHAGAHRGHRLPAFSLTGLARWAMTALQTRRERARLAQLDDHLLEDIGLDPAAVRAECRRPFWDLPR